MVNQRLLRIAQMLFTSEISDAEKKMANFVEEKFHKLENSFKDWKSKIDSNLKSFKSFNGNPETLRPKRNSIVEVFDKQKVKLEQIIVDIKSIIEYMNHIKDLEMNQMIIVLSQESENVSSIFNELISLKDTIGTGDFINQFVEKSEELSQVSDNFIQLIERFSKYISKNILGKHVLS